MRFVPLIYFILICSYSIFVESHTEDQDLLLNPDDFIGLLEDNVIPWKRIKKGTVTHIAVSRLAKGVKALDSLLTGAKNLPPTNILRRDYIKSGGAQRALKDFYSVKPHNIRTLEQDQMMLGDVGDRTIMFMYGVQEKFPSLTIYKTEDAQLPYSFYDKITYKGTK